MSTLVPFTSGYVALCAVQALTVLGPRPSPRLIRHTLLGLIPLAAIGGVALLIAEQPDLAQHATDLAAIATPIAAFGGIVAFRGRLRWLGLLAPLLYLIAWKGDGRPVQIATDALIAGATVTLAWLTGMVAPRIGLIIGIFAATAVDIYQVLVTEEVKQATQALAAAKPAAGLPRLQELVWGTASMGWGDAYLAALLGVVIATSPPRTRLIAAGAVFVLGIACGFLFHVIDIVPATVPVAGALVLVLVLDATVPASQGGTSSWLRRRRAATSGS
jgi:hypothetical protein